MGVTVILHRSPMYEQLRRHGEDNPTYLPVASGAFLRWSIPLIEQTDEYVFYTDVDVIFRSDPTRLLQALLPFDAPFLAAGEMMRGVHDGYRVNMNSGVMLINVPRFRQDLPALMAHRTRDLNKGFDQAGLINFYGSGWGRLPDILNWKPYWTIDSPEPSDQPVIIHFHGPKPAGLRTMIDGGHGISDAWTGLWKMNKEFYLRCLEEFEATLGHSAADQDPSIKFVIDDIKDGGRSINGWVINRGDNPAEPRIILFRDRVPTLLIYPHVPRSDVKNAGYRTDLVGYSTPGINPPLSGCTITAKNAYNYQSVIIQYHGWTGLALEVPA
jgi:hypothetical protein